jgi:2-methylisocitrate lyase-like PEP mutase family enzyme
VATRCWSSAPSAFSPVGPISRRRSPGSTPTRAGADCLYAPGIRTREQIAAVVAGVAPKPVNLLIGSASELTLREIAALGVRRVSVGGALARAAWGGFTRAAKLIAEQGRFDGFADAASGRELNSLFDEDLKKR